MKRALTVLLAAGATVASLVTPSSATSVAYCGYNTTSGSITYVPPLSVQAPAFQATTWTLTLHLECTGAAPSAGTYDITIKGSGIENCQAGTGGGNVQNGGTKTNAGLENGTVVGGGWNFTRGTLHYYGYPPNGNGNITVVNTLGQPRTFAMHLWLDVVPTVGGQAGGPCPGIGGKIIGHAAISE